MTAKHFPHQTGVGSVLYFGASITIADMIMADGRSLEHTGVTPDEVLVPAGADLAAGRDPVLARAAELAGVRLDPAESRRSLGVYTMLLAIEHTRRLGRRLYYPGYGTREPSPYDYKRNFAGLEEYDWRGRWLPISQK